MNPEIHESISEFTEISDAALQPVGLHFAASIGWGALAGTLSLGIPLIVSAYFSELVPGGLLLAVFVFVSAAMVTLAGALVIGLPVTALLKALRAEWAFLYAGVGAVAGLACTAPLDVGSPFALESLAFVGSFGAAGCATGYRWGRWREALALYRERLAEAAPDRLSPPSQDPNR